MSLAAQMQALREVQASATTERDRLAALRKTLTEYRQIADAKYVWIGGGFGTEPRVVCRFDGHEASDPAGRFTRIAGTAIHALLSAWLDEEFKSLEKQEAALASRDLIAEAAEKLRVPDAR